MRFQESPFLSWKIMLPYYFLGYWNRLEERKVDVEPIEVYILL